MTVASTGLYVLKSEHKKRAKEWGPAEKVSLRLGGNLMNVLNIVTPERTIRLQGEDPHLVVEWANTINTLVRGGASAGGGGSALGSIGEDDSTRQGLGGGGGRGGGNGERPSLNGGRSSHRLSLNGRPSLSHSGSSHGRSLLKSKPPPPKGLPPPQRRRPSKEPQGAQAQGGQGEVQNVMRAASGAAPLELEPPTPPGQVENVMQGMAASPRQGEGVASDAKPVHVVAFTVGLPGVLSCNTL